MNISIIGSGYVGLVSAACLADFGHFVTAIDNDVNKINRLSKGEIPIYEIGLEEIVKRNMKEHRLTFTTDLAAGIKNSPVVFIAVGTPSKADGSADLSYVEAVAKDIAGNISEYKVIVNKATVPVGTGFWMKELISKNLKTKTDFDIVSNPEFLREGSAVEDFMHPDRVIAGVESPRAEAVMKEVYRTLYLIETPFIITNLQTAELIKYASNTFLATKITFINEIANLCEAIGGDVQTVAKAMGLDGRIGPKFLHAGPGFGGSCFPKDARALTHIADQYGEKVSLVEAVIQANENQKLRMVRKIKKMVGPLQGKTIAILGLSFKPNTDDLREAPSLTIINGLLTEGAQIKAHDPVAIPEATKVFGDSVIYCNNAYEAVTGADALVIITEWNSYRRLDLEKIRSLMKTPTLIDLKNIYTPEEAAAAGFYYEGVGQSNLAAAVSEAAPSKENGAIE
jgi:UDPglucose 6-dehydrogenase